MMKRQRRPLNAVEEKRRSGNIYQQQRIRARNYSKELAYTLEEFREFLNEALSTGCHYCGGILTSGTWTADHDVPVARGGEHSLQNIIICCEPCNLAKGVLSSTEFLALLDTMKDWPASVRINTLARLRAGSQKAKFNGGLYA